MVLRSPPRMRREWCFRSSAQISPRIPGAAPRAFRLSTEVSGTTVTIAGYAAPLYYVSPTQLNVQIPYETFSGVTVPVIVTQRRTFCFFHHPSVCRRSRDLHRWQWRAGAGWNRSSRPDNFALSNRRRSREPEYSHGLGSFELHVGCKPARTSANSPGDNRRTRCSRGSSSEFRPGSSALSRSMLSYLRALRSGPNNVVVTMGGLPSNTAHLQVSAQ